MVTNPPAAVRGDTGSREDSRGLPLRAAVGASSARLQWKAWQRLALDQLVPQQQHHVQKELGRPASWVSKNDDQSVAAQPDEFLGQPAVLVGCLEPGYPVDGGGEQDAVTELGGPQAQSSGEVCFAGA